MRFFSRDSLVYADATLGLAFEGWDALHEAYTSMMPQWGGGQSYPLMVWGEIVDGNGSALVHLVDTPEMFGGEARIFASVEVRSGGIVRWLDHWDSRAFDDARYAAMRQADAPFPPDFGEQRSPSPAAPVLVAAAEALHSALAIGSSHDLEALLHPDVILDDVALATTRRGMTAAIAQLTKSDTPPPFGSGARLTRVVGGRGGGAYEWRAANDRPGITALSIDDEGLVLRMIAAYDHRAFAIGTGA